MTVDVKAAGEMLKEEKAAAPLTQEEMLDPDPPVTVTQGKGDQNMLAAIAEIAAAAEPEEKPKRKPRRTRAQVEADEAAAKTVDGGLAPEGAAAMSTTPRAEEPPWEEKEAAENTKEPPKMPSEIDGVKPPCDVVCELKAGGLEKDCPKCKGKCPDHDLFVQTGHGARTTESTKKAEEKAAKVEASKPKIDMGVLKERSKLRNVLSYLIEVGYTSPESLVDICLELKDQVPVLGRVANLSERIPRTLEFMKADAGG